MGDFLGSYYFQESESCNLKVMALLEAEQPVSIVEMDCVEVLKDCRVNRERIEQLDMLFIQDGSTDDKKLLRNEQNNDADQTYVTHRLEHKNDEDFELFSLIDFGKRLTGSTDNEVDITDIPVAPMSLLDSTICSMSTVPLSDVLSTNVDDSKVVQSICSQCAVSRCKCQKVHLLTSPLSESDTKSNIVPSHDECSTMENIAKKPLTVTQKMAKFALHKRTLMKIFHRKVFKNTEEHKVRSLPA